MTFEIKAPEFGVDIKGGEVTELFKKKGDYIKVGEILANLLLETREGAYLKYEVTLFHAGTISELLISQGNHVDSGQVLGVLDLDEDEEKKSE